MYLMILAIIFKKERFLRFNVSGTVVSKNNNDIQ